MSRRTNDLRLTPQSLPMHDAVLFGASLLLLSMNTWHLQNVLNTLFFNMSNFIVISMRVKNKMTPIHFEANHLQECMMRAFTSPTK